MMRIWYFALVRTKDIKSVGLSSLQNTKPYSVGNNTNKETHNVPAVVL